MSRSLQSGTLVLTLYDVLDLVLVRMEVQVMEVQVMEVSLPMP